MTTYPSSSLSSTPALSDEATLEAALECLLEHLPLVPEDSSCSAESLFEILLRAASRHDSIEHTAQRLQGVPSGNGIRYHLDQLDDMVALEGQLNGALQSRIPPKIRKRRHRIAIDLHLIPYYGNRTEAAAPYIYRSQAKAGTTTFFAYATVYVICRNKRVTLGIHAVHRQETLVATVTYLLAMLSALKIRVKRLYLDRGFYSVPVIRWLKALNIPFLMPAVIRGKTGGTRSLLVGRKSYATRYTLSSANYGSVTCQMRVVCTYYKGFKGKHGIQYALYVAHRVTIDLHQLHQHYRERFGIETSYRIKNQCRIRTTSKNPVVRLLFVALAFILVNLWVYLLWFFVSQTQRRGRVIHRELFGLKTMLEFLSQAVERHFPPITAIYLPTPK
ncbi:ISH3 family transposase (plasmid) [Kovacikia minuta CCNUW1]|uniref:ISH3 family transposase n=1 Tax=Kovacikia minuta TaxID=2931930 RepID=UPI001CCC3E33|nr:ISH3 family transposase [Kovacikia minuta]UBF28673.1 ISH3 family transposase [Kovacikia minuta CCNUW1]UBF30572.1 ISH3 family transposase [Kovacikia minuta CCNUW1]